MISVIEAVGLYAPMMGRPKIMLKKPNTPLYKTSLGAKGGLYKQKRQAEKNKGKAILNQ